jgi:hypothetical protein
MLKSLYKAAFCLILCVLVVAASGCSDNDNSGNRNSEDNPPPADTTPAPPAPTTSFKFGVMGDTQWTYDLSDPLGQNPETVAVSFINQMNQEFINHEVEFVIQVGDLTNYGYDAAIHARAVAAQDLYDAGIGYFPMRGNHEPWGDIFGAMVNNQEAIPAIQANFPQNQGLGANTGGATNFSSPTSVDPAYPNFNTEMAGISYAFDYNDGDGNSATFVIFDTWETASIHSATFSKWYGPPYNFTLPYPYGYPMSAQQDWISDRLDAGTRGTNHAFVFSHQPLIASNHEDSPFGFLDEHLDDQNLFYSELVANDVAFYISGHDHLHDLSMVKSPDGLSSVSQVISTPSCPKFYYPDYSTPEWRGQKYRRSVVSTEYNNTGYYIYTVEGPMVTCDWYADATGNWVAGSRPNRWPQGHPNELLLETPDFNFVLKESYKFSTNGKVFAVPQGASYGIVSDVFGGTSVRLAKTNAATGVECATCADPTTKTIPLAKRIVTGWKYQTAGLVSNILILDGMNKGVATPTSDPYLLIMKTGTSANIDMKIVALNGTGTWVDAATLTQAGQTFVAGGPDTSFALGSYGFNEATNEGWAVLDYDGTFAIRQY